MFDYKIESKTDYANFLKELQSFSKNETIEDYKRHVAIINTKQQVIAISMANIRQIAHKIYESGYEKFLDMSLSNDYLTEFYEETLIQGLVIAEIKDLELQIKYFKKWIFKIDNWGSCDSVVSTMKSLKKSKEKNKYFNFYLSLCYNEHEFVSRFGIIVLMTYYLEEEFIVQILKMCEDIKTDKYYINMAIAWLISFSFVKFKEKTHALFEKKTLSKFVQNKAISKCRDSFRVEKQEKEELMQLRIK